MSRQVNSTNGIGNHLDSLPQGWQRLPLGALCIQDRQIVVPQSLEASSRPYLGLEHIEGTSGRILRHATAGTLEEGKSTTFAFDSRHVLYGKLRPYLNKVALPDFTGRCTTELIPLLPNSQLIDRSFLAILLRREETVAAAMLDKTGSRMPRADMAVLLTLPVALPPLPEQRRIAARVREQLAEVQKARAAVEVQVEAAKDLPSLQLRDVFTQASAAHWPACKLGNILRLRKEVVHPRDNPSGPAIFVGLEHIQSLTGVRNGAIPIEMSQLTGRKPQFNRGDLVYGYLRPYLNKVWVAEFDGLCSVDQYVYEVRLDRAETEFVAWFMRSPLYLERAPIDTTPGQLPRIRTEEVAAVEIPLPSLKQQGTLLRRIQQEFTEARALSYALATRLAALDHLPAALLREAFAGPS